VAEREAGAALACLLELGAVVEAERARRVLDASARDGFGRSPLPEVTPREREVLRLLTEGLTNQQIAARLVVSEHTVHRHVTNILRKLDLPSRTAAAALAVRSGLLDTTRE
jgi:LuxR family transcriptional regulator, maltose regulon positive regulatory protein